ncbi:aspartyl-phosphate phosphatase Spo0E family protein [Bacillus sp. 165]|uniref:aspartyl-phosphate phosphatase Spo0E family protein n=1 Tax=Bacillus sp. 165 TaxID=1529117 RepID=UPI001FFE192F|nr:aspartyl-phosphate phosphatase Spo0E family protein [Bacillus sp. 165]
MDKLLLEIKYKREEMIETAFRDGFDSMETIRASQELDVLIVKYQRCKEKVDKVFVADILKNAACLLLSSYRKITQPLIKNFFALLMASILR